MKLRITLILALALTLALSGCGKDKAPQQTEATVPVLTEAPTQAPTVPPITEPMMETEAQETLPAFLEEITPTTEETVAPETTEATEAAEETEETEAAEEPSVSGKYSGTPARVTGYFEVNLRKGPSAETESLKKLKNGTQVTVLDVVTRDGKKWAYLGDGWMSMQYLKLDGPEPEAPDPALGELACVYNTDSLNVRAEPKGDAEVVGTLKIGDAVYLSEIKMVAGVEWGKTDAGWVSMEYMLRESNRKKATATYIPSYNPGILPNTPGVQPTFPPPEG